MRIVILGAGGFIGSHMVEHLIARDEHEVVGLDCTGEKLVGIEGDNFTFQEADIRQAPHHVDALIRDADVVVDLIAHANPSMCVASPLQVFDLNFMQNIEIARACIKYGARLIQYSSAEVYGKQTAGDAYSEDATDSVFGPVHKQRWIYATGKMLLERVLYAHGAAGDLEYTIVRPFNFLGSRIDYLVPAGAVGGPRVFPHSMSALLTGGPMRLVDGGRVHRAFMHIDDANAAFQILLDDRGAARNAIFKVGNPANNVTVRDFARVMRETYTELTGSEPASAVEEMSGEAFYGEGYEDGDRLPPDITKMKALGWAPQHDLRSAVRDAMCYYLAPPTATSSPLTRAPGAQAHRDAAPAASTLH